MERALKLVEELAEVILAIKDLDEKVRTLNVVREALHIVSPFAQEPVDLVRWVPADSVSGNEYNPNKVAPPEMRLLQHSIEADGYTQPIVTCEQEQGYEVVDGFHRHRVGKECESVRSRVQGYLPVVGINPSREGLNDRVAATIRHNRARGKHEVTAMSDIVRDLNKRCWSDEKIAKELGMEPDEVLRLKQISGLMELFSESEFSEAWEV